MATEIKKKFSLMNKGILGLVIMLMVISSGTVYGFLDNVEIGKPETQSSDSNPEAFSDETASTGSTMSSNTSQPAVNTGVFIITGDNAGKAYFGAVASVARAAVESDEQAKETYRRNAYDVLTKLKDYFSRLGEEGQEKNERVDAWMNTLMLTSGGN